MQLRLDAADRLVELVEERRGPVVAEDAARRLFALRQAPVALARSLLDGGRRGRRAPRMERRRRRARRAARGGARCSRTRRTSSSTSRRRDCGPGTSADLRDRGRPDPRARARGRVRDARRSRAAASRRGASALTGLRNEHLRGAPRPAEAVRRFLDVRGRRGARRPQRALRPRLPRPRDRAAHRLAYRRAGRRHRPRSRGRCSPDACKGFSLGAARVVPRDGRRGRAIARCPTRSATAELLLALIGLAQERGARTVADLGSLAATRSRRLLDKRHLAFGAPTRPGVYLFRGRGDQVLYVGRARDLRARLRSYFRQRPAAAGGRGRARRRRSGSSGGCSARSSRPRSRSCG